MKIIFILLVSISLSANAGFKVLNITTSIEVGNLYTDAITSVEFIPSTLDVTPSNDNRKFSDASTTFKIETDIPKEIIGISYTVNLVANSSTCLDYSGLESVQDNLVSLMFDSQPIVAGSPISVAEFNSDDGTNKYSEHNVELTFTPFAELATTSTLKSCDGEIEFNVEADI